MERLVRIEVEGEERFATLNLCPEVTVYGERLVSIEGAEYRVWDAFRSKLAAALTKGLAELPVREGSAVLYLGASTGTTVSHISDLVGEGGIVYAVEVAPRVARELVERVAKPHSNVVPIVEDARRLPEIVGVPEKVDLVYCDIAQSDQTEIAIKNCKAFMKPSGALLIAVKARSIDVTRKPKDVFKDEQEKLQRAGFRIIQVIDLAPFDKDHAMIHAAWRS